MMAEWDIIYTIRSAFLVIVTEQRKPAAKSAIRTKRSIPSSTGKS